MKQVLITGAGTGIGLACVEQFLKNDWRVLAHYNRSLSSLKKLAGARLEWIQADFTKEADIKRFIKAIEKKTLDVLINNAGIYDFSRKSARRIPAAENVLRANLIAPALITETVFEGMKERKKGHILNISSIACSYGGNADAMFYGLSKGGLEILTKTFARVGAPYNVCVNTLRLGVIDTDFHKAIKKDMNKRLNMIPMKRFGKPEEVARFAAHLVEEGFITNQVITMAGGE